MKRKLAILALILVASWPIIGWTWDVAGKPDKPDKDATSLRHYR